MGLAEACQPFIVGGFSGMCASCFIHPIDLAKVRLQLFTTMSPGLKKPTFVKVILEMVKKEGILSIYSGLSASLLRQAVYGTTRLGLHRTFSNELQRLNKGKPLPFYSKVFSAMSAGSIAVCVGTPCDVALVRMQSDSMAAKELRRGYKNVFDALFRILKEEGVAKLYSGLFPSVLRGMAVNTGMMAFYDQVSLAELSAVDAVYSYITSQSRELIQELRKEDPHQPTSRSTQLCAAAIAGFTNASMSIPFDQIKSRLRK